MRRCNSCNRDITKMRPNAKYCCRGCKSNDRKMRKYWELKRLKGIEEQLKLVESIKNMKKILENIKREE